MSEILLNQVTVIYNRGSSNEITALADINLLVNEGDFVSVVGSNGSGKSTLLKAISGIVPVTRGKIWIDGTNVTTLKPFERLRFVGLVQQSSTDSVAMGMTVQENLTLAFLKARKLSFCVQRSIRGEITRFLNSLGLQLLLDKLDVQVRELSGGQRQLLALAMAVIQRPSILLLDEHTAPLDPARREQMNNLTAQVSATGNVTTLMVSHSREDALQLGNRLIVLQNGKISKSFDSRQKERLKLGDLEFT